jgi:histidinol-phosphate aminotransferase
LQRRQDDALHDWKRLTPFGQYIQVPNRQPGADMAIDMISPKMTRLAATLPDTVPFVGPENIERARGRAFRARIGANESGFGPSPRVIAAIAENSGDVWKYCDPENFDLKVAIARHLGVSPDNVAPGEGVDGLLGLAARLYIEPGTKVVSSLGGYPTFHFHVTGFGGTLVTVPYRDDREDLEGLLEAVRREDAGVVYLANPDNPMGTWWPAAEIERFIEALPETTLLILDEAYGETAPVGTMPALDVTRPNVLRMRTLSKAYGLAGMRVGYAIGAAETIKAFDRVRNHFGINRLGQIAAISALADQDYLQDAIGRIVASRDTIAKIARSQGLTPIASATNFVAIDCGRDGAFAQKVLQGLIERDVFVRKPMAPVLDRCIRISAGPAAEMEIFAEALAGTLAALKD